MAKKVLLLTSWYFPHKVLRWQDAVVMMFNDKVDVVAEYDETIASPSMSMKLPAVLRLRRNISNRKRAVKFSRINVYTRDKFCCQYCGQKKPMSQLTYDHVIPRSRGGRTVWENIVTACYACNSKKDSMTADEAGMFPLTAPVRPTWLPLTPPYVDLETAPEQWLPFCEAIAQLA